MAVRIRRRRRAGNPEGRMPVLDHLRELRRRIITVLIIVALGGIAGWFLYGHILEILRHPYCSVPAKYRFTPRNGGGCVLIYHGVLDGFTARLKVCLIAGT